MKIASIVFIALGVLGIVCSSYMYNGIKLITVTASLGSFMCGIGVILSYFNFIKLNNTLIYSNDSYITNKKSRSKAV